MSGRFSYLLIIWALSLLLFACTSSVTETPAISTSSNEPLSDEPVLAQIGDEVKIYRSDWLAALSDQVTNLYQWEFDPIIAERALYALVDEAIFAKKSAELFPDPSLSDWERREKARADICQDIGVTEKDILAAYQATDAYNRPYQTRIFQFVWPSCAGFEQDGQPPQRVRELADKLKAHPQDAAKLCQEMQREKCGVKCGDFGYFSPMTLPYEVDRVVFGKALPQKQLRVEIVRTGKQYRVLRIGGHWPGREYELNEVHDLIRQELFKQRCDAAVRNFLNREGENQVVFPLGKPEALFDLKVNQQADIAFSSVPNMTFLAGGRITIGSTDAEINQRLRECRRYFGLVGTCRRAWFEDEILHEAYVRPFYLDNNEVTAEQFHKYQRETGQTQMPDPFENYPPTPQHPVVGVNQPEADKYCQSIGKRLPTFSEWQYAARGLERRRYPWGNQVPDGTRANFCDALCRKPYRDRANNDGYSGTAPIGSYPMGRSPEGIYDLAGNVREWTATLDKQKLYLAPGGSWYNAKDDLWSSDVRSLPPYFRHEMLGFRCAKDAKQ